MLILKKVFIIYTDKKNKMPQLHFYFFLRNANYAFLRITMLISLFNMYIFRTFSATVSWLESTKKFIYLMPVVTWKPVKRSVRHFQNT